MYREVVKVTEEKKYKRVVLKLSGEAMAGEKAGQMVPLLHRADPPGSGAGGIIPTDKRKTLWPKTKFLFP